MNASYYLIKQILPYLEPNIIKIHEPCNLSHLKQLIATLIGEIYVYHYDKNDNSRKDLTDSLGNVEFNIYDHRFEKIGIRKHRYRLKDRMPINIKTYGIYINLKNITIPKKFYMHGLVYFYDTTEFQMSLMGSIFQSDINKQKTKNTYGHEYETYIAEKYEKNGFNVILNGIEKSFNDGGIDIISENENSIILVQCKNWSLSNQYKINQKDLRAFVGDCYIYMRENNISKKSIGFHYIVSHDNILTKSAEIFLNKNTFIKFKCIPFDKDV